MEAFVTILDPKAVLPMRASEGAAGYDLSSIEEVGLAPGVPQLVRTGLAIQLSDVNTHIQIVSRSGLSLRGIIVLNSPGIVDNDYRGEIKVILLNMTKDVVTLDAGTRIAQMLIMAAGSIDISVVANLTTTERGSGGFGSTGA